MCPTHREQTIYSPSGQHARVACCMRCPIGEIGMMTVILLVQTIIQVYKKLSKLQYNNDSIEIDN